MTKKRCLRLGTAILAALLVTSGLSFAAETGADAPKAKGETALMEANQAINNPITSSTLFIMENDTTANQGKITTENRYLNTTLIEPLIPLSIGESGWNLINRPVIPIVSAEIPTSEPSGLDWSRKTGLGDIVFFSLLKPPSTGYFQWGVGPTLIMPTATNNDLGAEKWSTGPAAIALYTSPTLTYGALIQQWWSVAGDSDRKEVSKMNLQYFVARQFTPNWGFISAPIIVADWKAKSGNKWSVPISAGIAYSFLIGKTPSRVLFEPQVYLVQPDDFGPNWNVRLAFAMVLPKWF